MIRKLTALSILTLFLVVGLTLSADARQGTNRGLTLDQVQHYNLLNTKAQAPVPPEYPVDAKNPQLQSLGGYAAQATSPGFTTTRSYRDYQRSANAHRMVANRATAQTNLSVYSQTRPPGTGSAEYVEYMLFDPTVNGPGGVFDNTLAQTSPLTRAGGYAQTEADENGQAIVTCRERNGSEPYEPYTVYAYYDIDAGTGITLISSFLDTLVGLGHPYAPGLTNTHPRIAYQHVGGNWVTHVLMNEVPNISATKHVVTYWRKAGSGPAGTWTSAGMVIDTVTAPPVYGSWEIVASPVTDDVAIVWMAPIGDETDPDQDFGSSPYFRMSHDGGSS